MVRVFDSLLSLFVCGCGNPGRKNRRTWELAGSLQWAGPRFWAFRKSGRKRIKAMKRAGFKKSEYMLIGKTGYAYDGYWTIKLWNVLWFVFETCSKDGLATKKENKIHQSFDLDSILIISKSGRWRLSVSLYLTWMKVPGITVFTQDFSAWKAISKYRI